ncbi:hypothetical protein Csa_006776 [Cucumis sativus]|uniref:Uncharacterized protein n=1 Tax=Cucumis sativus TaxID=3659 RepID=A0A0A0LJI5_CUCSA|nr:hypothetical protein Csa_006776 [Cucumis sativus]
MALLHSQNFFEILKCGLINSCANEVINIIAIALRRGFLRFNETWPKGACLVSYSKTCCFPLESGSSTLTLISICNYGLSQWSLLNAFYNLLISQLLERLSSCPASEEESHHY